MNNCTLLFWRGILLGIFVKIFAEYFSTFSFVVVDHFVVFHLSVLTDVTDSGI
jgi:hypothetical protein